MDVQVSIALVQSDKGVEADEDASGCSGQCSPVIRIAPSFASRYTLFRAHRHNLFAVKLAVGDQYVSLYTTTTRRI